jgi:signal transduction histidine kinase/HAMP domain-containing protein
MSFIFTLISPSAYFDPLHDLVGWISYFVLLSVIISLVWRTRRYNARLFSAQSGHSQFVLLAILAIATPLCSLVFGLRLPPGSALPPPELAVDPTGPALMFFAALPWVLAAGMLGPAPAAGLAFVSGFLLAYWDTHSLFLPFELALLAMLYSTAIRQRYRTKLFQWLRSPLVAAGVTTLAFIFLDLIIRPLSVRGMAASRLDYTLTNLPVNTLALGIELLIAGLGTQGIAFWLPKRWGLSTPLRPSPSERSLSARFLFSMAPLAFVALLTLMVGDWLAAGWAARDMFERRMGDTARLAAESIPYYLETGQNLISQLAKDPRLLSKDSNELTQTLVSDIRQVPFFTQITVLDTESQVLASYPTADFVGLQAPIEEITGVQIAIRDGVPYQTFTIQPATGQTTAQTSFVAAIFDESEVVRAVLIGRSDLSANPFTRPIIHSLESMAQEDGIGMLLDEDSRILVHPDVSRILTHYDGQTPETPSFFDSTAPDGTRMLTYYYQAEGRPWAVVLSVPARRAQQYAINIAAPLLGIVLVISVIGVVLSRLGLRVVTASLQNLTLEAGRLSQGKLDQPLTVEGVDEVGQLRRAFEQMRASLKARLDELNRLLLVSQGVASSLEMSEAVQPVLEAVLAAGANSARVVLTPSVIPELDGTTSNPISYGMGPENAAYSSLDEQVLALTRQQERLVQPNTNRPRLLNFAPGITRPESLLAVALRHENLYYGTLWAAYDKPHVFSEEEVRFVVTLASQAALAAANTRLFLNAEVGRQRLAAILASSPDPVLVTDQRERLLLANPAAWQALETGISDAEGQPIEKIISQSELLDLLRSTNAEKQTREVTLPDGRVYLATATTVLAESQRVGRVCVMRDVTHFKELDALKSEFVATVSHDLRSPLTLMRGYATMLEMVGQLNEQQVGYVRKIIDGVESMARLVNNLLDLGRIDAGVGLQLEMIPVQDVIERVVNSLQLQAAQKHITLSYEIPQQTIPLIEADQALLQQALHNLVENAIKYTRPDGKVHVSTRVEPSGLVFEVTDNGIGVSPMDLPRLFEKFYRGAQQAAREQRGTGLGLAIVKSIAERHGGEVHAESQLGKGSTFTLSIPLHQPR